MKALRDRRSQLLRAATASTQQEEPPSRLRACAARDRQPASRASARTTIDIILQGSTVELFHAHGVAVAPLGSALVGAQQRYHESAGMLGFDGPSFSGTLTLSLPTPVFQAHCEGRPRSDTTTLGDWTQELTNQLLGRIKNRLSVFQTSIRSHLPSVMSGLVLERLRKRTPSEILYRFRSLRGDILVTLDAPLGDAVLVYSGSTAVAQEGEIILF